MKDFLKRYIIVFERRVFDDERYDEKKAEVVP